MELIFVFTIFILAIFVGNEVISKVPTLLHTPLMSGSNAISGITVVGAILFAGLALSKDESEVIFLGYTSTHILSFFAVIFATINVVGGFFVTHRMLDKFKRKDKKP